MRTFVTVALAVLVSACGRPSIPCTTSNCTGCCDASGQCVSLATASACGSNGGACVQCQASQSCQFGTCVGGFGTGGGSSGGSSSSGGGLASGGGSAGGSSSGGGLASGGGVATGGGSAGGSSGPAPDVLFLVDVSGSMNAPLIENGPTCGTCSGATCPATCPTRASALRGALASFLQASSSRARFGLTTFPSAQTFTPPGCAPPTSEAVPMLLQATPDSPSALQAQTTAVQNAVAGIGTTIAVTGGTPTAGALRYAATFAPLRTPSGRMRGVVLVTDGLPNCNPSNLVSCMNMPLPSADLCTLGANCVGAYCAAGYIDQVATVQAVAALRAQGVRTAVVVISEVLAPQVTTVMNAMADEGGAPVCSGCSQRFAFANDQTALDAALRSAFARVTVVP